jgi:hypothetical protein
LPDCPSDHLTPEEVGNQVAGFEPAAGNLLGALDCLVAKPDAWLSWCGTQWLVGKILPPRLNVVLLELRVSLLLRVVAEDLEELLVGLLPPLAEIVLGGIPKYG